MTITLSDNDVEFLAARVRRLCEAFDYPVPEGQNDEFVVGVAGSLIGGLLCRLDTQKPIAWARWPGFSRKTGCYPQVSAFDPVIYQGWVPLMEKPMKLRGSYLDPAEGDKATPAPKPQVLRLTGVQIEQIFTPGITPPSSLHGWSRLLSSEPTASTSDP